MPSLYKITLQVQLCTKLYKALTLTLTSALLDLHSLVVAIQMRPLTLLQPSSSLMDGQDHFDPRATNSHLELSIELSRTTTPPTTFQNSPHQCSTWQASPGYSRMFQTHPGFSGHFKVLPLSGIFQATLDPSTTFQSLPAYSSPFWLLPDPSSTFGHFKCCSSCHRNYRGVTQGNSPVTQNGLSDPYTFSPWL